MKHVVYIYQKDGLTLNLKFVLDNQNVKTVTENMDVSYLELLKYTVLKVTEKYQEKKL